MKLSIIYPGVAVTEAVLVTAFSNALTMALPALSAAVVATEVPELDTCAELVPEPEPPNDLAEDELGGDGTLVLPDGVGCVGGAPARFSLPRRGPVCPETTLPEFAGTDMSPLPDCRLMSRPAAAPDAVEEAE